MLYVSPAPEPELVIAHRYEAPDHSPDDFFVEPPT